MPISSPLFVNVCTACVCMLLRVSVCVYTVLCVSLYSSPLQKAPVQIITSPACPSYCPTNAMLCVSLHTQIVCKWPRAVCVSTCRVFTATPPGKSVGRRRLALRVYRLLYPAESKVAEFVCKFKCLLPHATLNFDLHVGPRCR